MNRHQAEQVASMLNEQNELTIKYSADIVLLDADNYLIHQDSNGNVVACAELREVQWYQYELSHVTVATAHKREGHGRTLLKEAEERARNNNASILQCTIRAGNVPSESLFSTYGFKSVCRFYNLSSKKTVAVWQYVLSVAPAAN